MNPRQPSASILVKALVQPGLAEARRDGPDRRTLQLHPLPRGQALLRKVPGPMTGGCPRRWPRSTAGPCRACKPTWLG